MNLACRIIAFTNKGHDIPSQYLDAWPSVCQSEERGPCGSVKVLQQIGEGRS